MQREISFKSPPEEQNRRPVWPHLAMGAYALGWALAMDFGGRLYIAELITAVGLFIFVQASLLRHISLPLKTVLGCYSFWVVAIIVSDVTAQTAAVDSIRAMSTPILGAVSLLFVVAVLQQNVYSILSYLAISAIAKAVFGEPLYGDTFSNWELSWQTIQQDTNVFKVKVVPALTPAIALFSWYLARSNLVRPSVFLLVCSIGYFALDARSSGASLLVGSAILLAIHVGFRAKRHLLPGLAATIVLSYAGYAGYIGYTLAAGAEGHNARQVARMENPYNPVELVLQGRPEWSLADRVISESPMLGHGSWARDERGEYASMMLESIGVNSTADAQYDPDRYIPVHSLILSSWVWSGFLGVSAALYLLVLVVRYSLTALRGPSRLLPIVAIFGVEAAWAILFSPPQAVRFLLPHAFGLIIVVAGPMYRRNIVRRTSPIPPLCLDQRRAL